VGVICYSPLAQAILTGRYASLEEIPAGRRRPRYCDEGRAELAFDVVEELRAVSEEIGEPMAAVALAWVLAQPGVTSVIAGASTPEQASENARAGNLQLPAGLVERLTRASEPLKESLDRNPDMWQAGERSRYR
ncbi:MAG: aldo/keto reductase, partial [Candidatus Brocadiia bacterium]